MKMWSVILVICFGLVGCESNATNPTNSIDEQQQYLDENAVKTGVSITASGLQYEVLQSGSGASPNANDTVTVHYVGMYIDGTEFDNSYQRNEPVTFPLGGVLLGLAEGIQLMSVGSIYRFVMPAELTIQPSPEHDPDAVLIFTVELLEINSA